MLIEFSAMEGVALSGLFRADEPSHGFRLYLKLRRTFTVFDEHIKEITTALQALPFAVTFLGHLRLII